MSDFYKIMLNISEYFKKKLRYADVYMYFLFIPNLNGIWFCLES